MTQIGNPTGGSRVTFSRRSFLMGAVLATASGVALARQPQIVHPVVAKDKFRSWMPDQFGQWRMVGASGVILPPEDSLSDRLYDNLVTRVYAAPDQPAVMLLMAYNNVQDGVLQVHRPEVCYPVGGFELTPTRPMALTVGSKRIAANIFTASSPDRVEQVVYFTRVGDAFPRTWAQQRFAVVEENLARKIPDGMMLRVSCLDLKQAEAGILLKEFVQQLYAASDVQLQRLLVGQIQ